MTSFSDHDGAAPRLRRDSTPEQYGRWAMVAGASEGLGAAFAESLAKRGCNLILIARREPLLKELAAKLTAAHNIEIKTIALDLAGSDYVTTLRELSNQLEIGVAVYNAAYSFIGPLLEKPLEEALRVVEVNVQGPLKLVHAVAPAMLQRKRGAIVLMSSIAGFQGLPRLAAYAASKAFITVLGESLWGELRAQGVEVLVSCAGAIRTPAYAKTGMKEAPGTLSPEEVSERTLNAIGKGPVVVPGGVNKLARIVLGRLLSRRGAVEMMARNTSALE